jgi:hypothetical protein
VPLLKNQRCKIYNLNAPNFLEKQEVKLKSSRWREITKIRAEINKWRLKSQSKESMKQKSWFFGMINKIDKLLDKLNKRRREKTQNNKIRDEKGVITIHTNENQRIIRKYFKNLYSNKLENLEEMDKFLDAYNLLS